MMGSRVLTVLQKLGQSLMIPVSVLPAAGLAVALGRALQSMGADGTFVHQLGAVFLSGGIAVFEQLPVVFAVGVAIGFTGGAGVAGLSAVAGYFTLLNLLKLFTEMRGLALPLNTGVFGGITIGLITAWLYNRYSTTKLHPVLGFFAGKRLVPILTVFATLFVGLAFGFAWPPIQNGINEFGQWIMGSSFSAAFYAAGKRLLIPVGLHHVFYQPFLFQFGEFVTAAGKVVHGDSVRYFAGDPTAGIMMASEFPIMLFGLPAAALAMVLRAEKSRRKAIAGVMLTAALTSIITGITEPIEFAFIFVAPMLYVVHVALAFVSGWITQSLDIHLGYTFSASLIDYILGFFNQKNGLSLWTIAGPVMAVLYFGSFYTLIGLFDFKTPGREVESDDAKSALPLPVGGSELAAAVLAAIGGAGNIESLDACITRLRLVVKNPAAVDSKRLTALGASGFFHDGGKNFQIVFGTKSDALKEEILALTRLPGSAGLTAPSVPMSPSSGGPMSTAPVTKTALGPEGTSFVIGSPMKGKVVPLAQVPDKTFAQKVLGEGIAIEPTEGVVYAPFDATVAQVFRTGHAIGLLGPQGVELLVHVGIDTVKMGGEGFHPMVKTGDTVRKGDRLLEFDLEKIRAKAPSILTPVVITNSESFQKVSPADGPRTVGQGDRVIELTTEA